MIPAQNKPSRIEYQVDTIDDGNPHLVEFAWFDQLDGKYDRALQRLSAVSREVVQDGQFTYRPTDLRRGQIHELLEQPDQARKYYEAEAEDITSEDIVRKILDAVPVP